MRAYALIRILIRPGRRTTGMTARNGRLTPLTFVGHSHDLALRADWNKQLAHSPCHGTQIAADLLRSVELKFDQLGEAVSLHYMGAKRAQTSSDADRHQATTGDRSRLLSKTDNTFEKLRRDGGIRTRGLLLPNQLHPDAGRREMMPDVE